MAQIYITGLSLYKFRMREVLRCFGDYMQGTTNKELGLWDFGTWSCQMLVGQQFRYYLVFSTLETAARSMTTRTWQLRRSGKKGTAFFPETWRAVFVKPKDIQLQ